MSDHYSYFYEIPLICYVLQHLKAEFMLKYVSGINSSFRHWVVRKFAVHGHVCFVCSVFESPWFGGKIGICTVIKAVFDSLASEYYVWNPSTSEGLRLPCKPASDHCGRRCDRNIKLAWGEGGVSEINFMFQNLFAILSINGRFKWG